MSITSDRLALRNLVKRYGAEDVVGFINESACDTILTDPAEILKCYKRCQALDKQAMELSKQADELCYECDESDDIGYGMYCYLGGDNDCSKCINAKRREICKQRDEASRQEKEQRRIFNDSIEEMKD